MEACEHKEPDPKPDHNRTHKQMLAQLPLEIVDQIVGYLDFEDVRSIACVCSAFRLPAQLRLFRTIKTDAGIYVDGFPYRMEWILSSPHLLQYPSCLMVHSFGSMDSMDRISIQSMWPHLPIMYRLRTMYIYLEPNDCSRALSALESLGSAREIALIFRSDLVRDILISDNPLPVHLLELTVNPFNHQVVQRLIQKILQSLRQLHLRIEYSITPLLNFLPHLYEFSVETSLFHRSNTPDLVSFFPFLNEHPTITRLSLDYEFTLTVQPSPNLLPNLQFLSATPAIIERLIPGRAVDDIYAVCRSRPPHRFPVEIMLQPLRQAFVPVTTLAIKASAAMPLPNDLLLNIVQALPKLRKFTLQWKFYEVRQLFEGKGNLKLTGNRFMSHYEAFYLLLGDAGTWFISG